MIDIHSHIIPFVDDGCENINDTLELVNCCSKLGIDKIIATPHYIVGQYENFKDDVLNHVDFLNNFFRISGIDITAKPGNEIMISPEIIDLLKEGKLCSLNNSRYVLIEFPLEVKIRNILDVIRNVIFAGFIPVIAHPERYTYLQKNIDEAINYVESGALLQMNISSIIGDYGEDVKEFAIKLLKHNLIHLWGSDAHSFRNVYTKLDKSFKELKKIVGEEKFKQITEINPECVYSDLDIKTFDIKYKLGFFS